MNEQTNGRMGIVKLNSKNVNSCNYTSVQLKNK